MNSFHTGQRVVCIDNEQSKLSLNHCYVVTDVVVENFREVLYLAGEKLCWLAFRFEDADQHYKQKNEYQLEK